MRGFSVNIYGDGTVFSRNQRIEKRDLAILLVFDRKINVRVDRVECVMKGVNCSSLHDRETIIYIALPSEKP